MTISNPKMFDVTNQLNTTMAKLGAGPYQLVVLLLGGGVYAAEGSLLLMLSVIAKGLIIRWQLSPMMAASITTMILVGLVIGTLIGGVVTDSYGRRMPILLTYAGIAFFITLVILAPGLYSLFFAKFALGFSLGFGVPAANALVCESSPSQHRVNIYAMTQVLFSLGQIYSATIIWVWSPNIDHQEMTTTWRWMLACAAALPFVLLLLASFFLHESVHWLVTVGKIEEAGNAIRGMAWYKMTTVAQTPRASRLPLGGDDVLDKYAVEELIRKLEVAYQISSASSSSDADDTDDSGQIEAATKNERTPLLDTTSKSGDAKIDAKRKGNTESKGGCWSEGFQRMGILFGEEYRQTTIIMCWVCFVCNFAYYGMIYGLPDTLKREHNEDGKVDVRGESQQSPAATVLIAAMFEIPGVFVAIVLGTTVSRRANLFISYFMVGVCLVQVVWGIMNSDMENLGMVGVFGTKLFIASAFIVTYLYLLECYLTKIRATALAFCMVVGRMGAFVCPFLYDGFLMSGLDHWWFFVTMGALAFSAAAISMLLAYETKDAELVDG